MSIVCYEITHAGEGERGQLVSMPAGVRSAREYAEIAAERFDQRELDGPCQVSEAEFADSCRVIEVTGLPIGPVRFCVATRIKRYYESAEVPG